MLTKTVTVVCGGERSYSRTGYMRGSEPDLADLGVTGWDVGEMRAAKSVGLLGACVARDMTRSLFSGRSASVYFWRIGTISLMSAAPSLLRFDLAPDHDARQTLERDINKTFDLPLLLHQPYVVVDFFRDMYAVLRLRDGRYVTNGIDVQDLTPNKLGLDITDRIEAYEARYRDLWLDAFGRFAELANRSAARFIITPIYQMGTFLENGRFRVEENWDAEQITTRNRLLGFMQRIALTRLHRAIMAPILPEELELDPKHEYGPGPYHYRPSVFSRAIDIMLDTPELVQHVTADLTRREAIVASEASAWARAVGLNNSTASGNTVQSPARVAAQPIAKSPNSIHRTAKEQIEIVLPIRAFNDEHGSDLQRTRSGLIATVNRFCDPAVVRRLSIIVPKGDVAAASELATECIINIEVVPEDELVPVERIGAIPRRSWYIQQLVKLAYSQSCRTKFYLTLTSDIFLIASLETSIIQGGLAPIQREPVRRIQVGGRQAPMHWGSIGRRSD